MACPLADEAEDRRLLTPARVLKSVRSCEEQALQPWAPIFHAWTCYREVQQKGTPFPVPDTVPVALKAVWQWWATVYAVFSVGGDLAPVQAQLVEEGLAWAVHAPSAAVRRRTGENRGAAAASPDTHPHCPTKLCRAACGLAASATSANDC